MRSMRIFAAPFPDVCAESKLSMSYAGQSIGTETIEGEISALTAKSSTPAMDSEPELALPVKANALSWPAGSGSSPRRPP